MLGSSGACMGIRGEAVNPGTKPGPSRLGETGGTKFDLGKS